MKFFPGSVPKADEESPLFIYSWSFFLNPLKIASMFMMSERRRTYSLTQYVCFPHYIAKLVGNNCHLKNKSNKLKGTIKNYPLRKL